MKFFSILNICAILTLLYVSEATKGKKLIVVLIDGCRWDYIDEPTLKGIPRMIQNGVRASYVVPVYPSLSYPNYYSIATGLFPENHGFVNNIMYDAEKNESYLMLPNPHSTDPHWWNEAEPIWVTAEKNGIKTGLYWWAGCEVEIKGITPTLCEIHRYGPGTAAEKIDFIEKVDELIEMFKPARAAARGNNQISVALMYYGPVDYNGHYSGPTSEETKRAVRDIDDILDEMQTKIKDAGLEDEVNIMIVADHGMTELGPEITTYIDLERFDENIKYQITGGATAMLVAKEGMREKLYQDIKQAQIKGLRIYKKEDIPEEYHIKHSKRMSPLFLLAEKGYYIKQYAIAAKRIGGEFEPYKGTHGYDPMEVVDMRSIFAARGPDFRKGYQTQDLNNVDFYNIMCHVLGINPLPNNGSWDRVNPMLNLDGNSAPGSIYHAPFYTFSLTIMTMFFTYVLHKN